MAYIRQKDIFICLLNSNIGLSGNELAKMFNVSSRTIRSDIKFLNELFKEHGVSIYSSKQEGYFIPKEQKNIGISLTKEIFSREEALIKIPNTPFERFALYETIINVLNKYGYILIDADLCLLVKDVLVSIKRIQMGFIIEEGIEEEVDLTIVKVIKEEIEDYFNISINNMELEYF